jgi:uncharacterized protein DUF4352
VRFLLGIALVLVSCGPTTEGRPGNVGPSAQGRTPTAEPTLRAKMGTPVTFSDGFKISVLRLEEQKPTGGFFESTPHPGYRFVAVFVRAENGSPQSVEIEDRHFTLQDGQGVRHQYELFGPDRPDKFNGGNIAPGGTLAGALSFEAPAGDAKLELIFEKVGYRQVTFELF